MKPFVFLFLCVAPYFLTVSANWIFDIPSTIIVGVPVHATLTPTSPSDRSLIPYLAQSRPGQDPNDVNSFSTNFSNPLHMDPNTGKVEFTAEVAGAYLIKMWLHDNSKPVQNSVVMNAVLPSNSTTPSTPLSSSTKPADAQTPSNSSVNSSSSDSSNTRKTILIAVLVSVSVIVISAALIFVFWYRARNLKKQQHLMSSAGSEVSSHFHGERMIRKNYESGTYNGNMHAIPALRFSATTVTGPHSDVGSIKSYTVAPESMFYGGSVTIAPSDSISQIGYQGRFKKIVEDDDEDEDEAEYRETRDRNRDRGRDVESFRSLSVQPEDRWRSSSESGDPGMQEYAHHHYQSSPVVRNLPPLPQTYRP